MSWPLLSVAAISEGLETARIGRVVTVLDEAISTNDLALAAVEAEAPLDGLAVFAEFQTAGRGRQGRSWHAPRGASVLCSVLTLGPDDMARAGFLTLVAGVAACDAIRESTAVWPAVRWPNDVFVRGKKVGGVLVESRPMRDKRRAWVIGVGINCYQHANHFPPEIRDRATSLELECDHAVDRVRVARELLRQLDRWLAAGAAADTCAPGGEKAPAKLCAPQPPLVREASRSPATEAMGRPGAENSPEAERVRQAWLERAELIGERVRILSEGRKFEGRMLDVDPQAGLLVQLDDGVRRWFDATRTQIQC